MESARKHAVTPGAGLTLGGVGACLCELPREVHLGAVIPPISRHAIKHPQNGEFLRLGGELARQDECALQPGHNFFRRSAVEVLRKRDADFERKFVFPATGLELQDVQEGGFQILSMLDQARP